MITHRPLSFVQLVVSRMKSRITKSQRDMLPDVFKLYAKIYLRLVQQRGSLIPSIAGARYVHIPTTCSIVTCSSKNPAYGGPSRNFWSIVVYPKEHESSSISIHLCSRHARRYAKLQRLMLPINIAHQRIKQIGPLFTQFVEGLDQLARENHTCVICGMKIRRWMSYEHRSRDLYICSDCKRWSRWLHLTEMCLLLSHLLVRDVVLLIAQMTHAADQ